ncbi:hypothetical protein [Dactylosporangium cerinum]
MTATGTWDQDTFAAAVGEAVLAPSIHNSQPWRFRRTVHGIEVHVDQDRVLPVCDPDGRAARVSCGAAATNLALALAVAGGPAACTAGPGVVRLVPAEARSATPLERRLHRQIPLRRTNRAPFVQAHVDPGVLATLAEAVAGRVAGWTSLWMSRSSPSWRRSPARPTRDWPRIPATWPNCAPGAGPRTWPSRASAGRRPVPPRTPMS